MTYEEAEALVAETLAPLSMAEFFKAVGKTGVEARGSESHPRVQLFGEDPKNTLLAGYATHAGKLDFHAANPTEPPPAAGPVSSPDEFLKLIKSFHERGYTVRVPDVVSLSPELQRFARAFECVTRVPVSAAIFWSAADAQAPVHYDKPDNIAIQLEGRKRWFISTDPPGLENKWMQVGEPLPSIERHRVVDVGPGDLLYIPHGTPHTVQSTTESVHLAILFEPTSVRDALIAAVDFLSDNDRTLRETAIGRVRDADFARLTAQVLDGLGRLLAHSRSPDFLKAALDLHWSRVTAGLPALTKSADGAAVTRDTLLRHSPLAISYLRPSFGALDFSLPGGHIPVHPGVEPELQFIASTESFRVADMPGAAGEDVKIALIKRLIDSGFLEIAS
jgi:hypothetical protein